MFKTWKLLFTIVQNYFKVLNRNCVDNNLKEFIEQLNTQKKYLAKMNQL